MESQPNCWSMERGYYYQRPGRGWQVSSLQLILLTFAICLSLLFAAHLYVASWTEAANASAAPLSLTVPGLDAKLASSISTGIAGHPMGVNCQLGDNGYILGETYVKGSTNYLTKAMCQGLVDYSSWSPTERQCVSTSVIGSPSCGLRVDHSILSMQVIAHEAFHAQGVVDERMTDCYAVQNVAYVAGKLGADASFAAAISRYLWSHYDAIRMPPATYALTSGCVDGGSLDLRPDSSSWPG
jgi:hypothetical protein